MVESVVEVLDARFAALGDATRRRLLARLAKGESSVTDLAAPFDLTFAAVSKHLQVLVAAGLVTRRRAGRQQLYGLLPGGFDAPGRWLDRTRAEWESRLDRMQRLAEEGR
jgi:DNA-binding transcriptional ArsR family regulator